jgi:exosortase/archaeosortase family protein
VLGFALRLLAGWAIAIVALSLAPGIERGAVDGTVWSVAAALRLLALQPQVADATIQLGRAALIIIPECTPVMPVLLLAIAILAYPAGLRWKLAGIAAGLVTLWLFNVVRMLALFATLVWRPEWFKFMHVYLWQSITLLVVSALFLAWLRHAPSGPRAKHAP